MIKNSNQKPGSIYVNNLLEYGRTVIGHPKIGNLWIEGFFFGLPGFCLPEPDSQVVMLWLPGLLP